MLFRSETGREVKEISTAGKEALARLERQTAERTETERKSLALPPPPPDPLAWYMWKGDEWMGYDWRNPRSKLRYEAHQRQLQLAREAAKRRRRERGPSPNLSKGSLDFRGFRWLCPHCGRAVNVLFLPLPPINLLAHAVPALKKFDVTTPIRWNAIDRKSVV